MKINSTQFEVRGGVIYFPLVGGRKGTGAPQCWEKDGMTQFEGGGKGSLHVHGKGEKSSLQFEGKGGQVPLGLGA